MRWAGHVACMGEERKVYNKLKIREMNQAHYENKAENHASKKQF
jgi:hypothetical protein